MMRKGYLEQQIEGLGVVLAHLLRLKNGDDPAALLREIRSSGKQLLGLDTATLVSLSDDTLLLLCSSHGVFDAGKAVAAASLLNEQAEAQTAAHQPAAANVGRQKSLVLLTEALRFEERLRTPEFLSLVERVRGAIPAAPAPLLGRLFRFYEEVGQYAHAEDVLFALRDADPVAATSEEAVAFYERLLTLPEATLEAANLPRAEVLEGLAAAREAA